MRPPPLRAAGGRLSFVPESLDPFAFSDPFALLESFTFFFTFLESSALPVLSSDGPRRRHPFLSMTGPDALPVVSNDVFNPVD